MKPKNLSNFKVFELENINVMEFCPEQGVRDHALRSILFAL